jgi:membrane associated rhomboid family serine protease
MTTFRNSFLSLPFGARLMLLVYALGFPIALAGHYTHTFELYAWLGLSPARVWKGEVWRMFTYGFLPAGPVDWVVNVFWLFTLVGVLGRNWSALQFWGYCLLGIFAGAVPLVLLKSGMESYLAGTAGMIFALLVAWDWFYRRERLVLLGLGEISVRQAVVLIAIINSLILFFCCGGWFFMLAMWCGGVAGWLYLFVRWKLVMGKSGQQVRSERVARLEL